MSKVKRVAKSKRAKPKPERVTVAVAFFDCWCFKKEVNTWGRSCLWWFLRVWLGSKPWHVLVVLDGYIYEMCFWQGCIRYRMKDLVRYPYRVYHVTQDVDVADLMPWCRGDKVTRLRATLAVLGFHKLRGTVNCATTVCSLLGIEPPLQSPEQLMEHLESNCRE